MGLRDGLGFEEVNQPVTSTAVVKATTFSGTDFVNGEGELQSVGVGSGTFTYGGIVGAGSSALGAGSNAWIEFATAYSNKPIVVATDITTADQGLLIGSIGIGSFYIEGPTASDEFNWIAVGL